MRPRGEALLKRLDITCESAEEKLDALTDSYLDMESDQESFELRIQAALKAEANARAALAVLSDVLDRCDIHGDPGRLYSPAERIERIARAARSAA